MRSQQQVYVRSNTAPIGVLDDALFTKTRCTDLLDILVCDKPPKWTPMARPSKWPHARAKGRKEKHKRSQSNLFMLSGQCYDRQTKFVDLNHFRFGGVIAKSLTATVVSAERLQSACIKNTPPPANLADVHTPLSHSGASWGSAISTRNPNRTFAVKVYTVGSVVPNKSLPSKQYALFHNEYTNLHRFQGHQGVLALTGWGCAGGFPALIFEHLGGPNLRQWLDSAECTTAFPPHLLLFHRFDLVMQVASVVAYLNSKNVEHCDIKPENFVFRCQDESSGEFFSSALTSDAAVPSMSSELVLIDFASASPRSSEECPVGVLSTSCGSSSTLWNDDAPSSDASSQIPRVNSLSGCWEGRQQAWDKSKATAAYAAPETFFAADMRRSASCSNGPQQSLCTVDEMEDALLLETDYTVNSMCSGMHSERRDLNLVRDRTHSESSQWSTDEQQKFTVFGARDVWAMGLVISEILGGQELGDFGDWSYEEISQHMFRSAQPVEVPDEICSYLAENFCAYFIYHYHSSRVEVMPHHRSCLNFCGDVSQATSEVQIRTVALLRRCLDPNPMSRPTAADVLAEVESLFRLIRDMYKHLARVLSFANHSSGP